MNYRIEFTNAARQGIVHLPPEIKQQIREGLRLLSVDPYAGEPLKRELEGKRKFRIGRYRIVYEMEPARKVVLISAVGHRGKVYELF